LLILELYGKEKRVTTTFTELTAKLCEVHSHVVVAQFSDPGACVQQAWAQLKKSLKRSTGGKFVLVR
jgi:predicted transcriptional regulator